MLTNKVFRYIILVVKKERDVLYPPDMRIAIGQMPIFYYV